MGEREEQGEPPESRRVRLTLEFDGTEFYGWQRQATGERTVQGALEAAFAALPGEHGPVVAAGRTDAGVHALALSAHADTTSKIPDERLRLALNAHLPRDVAVVSLSTVGREFEAQFSCRYRRYLYRMRVMRDDPRGLALNRARLLPVFRQLDVAAMKAAAGEFTGTHDFRSLATQEAREVTRGNRPAGHSTVRTLYLSELREERGELRLHVVGNGFLRNMIRAMVGTLLWVGKGKLRPEEIAGVLAARDRRRAGHNVGPQGLYFVEAGYGEYDAVSSEALVEQLII